MRRALGAVTVLFMIAASMGVSHAAAAQETADAAPVTLAGTLSAAASAGADSPGELSAAVGVPTEGPGALTFDGEGRVAATVRFDGAPGDAQREAVRAVARIDRELRFLSSFSVSVEAVRLPELSDIPGVVSVTPVLRPIVGTAGAAAALAAAPADASADPDDCRAFPGDALAPLRADIAAAGFDVDGSGVTVGVISDSFASGTSFATTPEEDVALGVLPGPGNPCGHETPVEVLGDSEYGGDEGRAMAQLVHAIAPGARILFHTGEGGSVAMANAIFQLAQGGADIIVDDLGYADEPHFQQGFISAAISEVRAQGIAYYSSSGNGNVVGAEGTASAGKPIASWQTARYRPTECPEWVVAPEGATTFDCLDFDPAGGGDPTDTLGLGAEARMAMLLSWSEPMFGVTTTLLPQLYVDRGEGPEPVGTATLLDEVTPSSLVSMSDEEEPIDGEADLVIVRDTSDGQAGTPAVWAMPWSGGRQIAWREHDESVGDDVVGLISNGHPADGSAVGVAAADWRTPTAPESYTSPGQGAMYFEPVNLLEPAPSPALAEPLEVPGPQLASVDGNRTSFFHAPADADGHYYFYGTSAAAPNAAAVHALALSYAPGTAEGTVVAAAAATARDMDNPYAPYLTDRQLFGAGLIDADALLAQLPVPAVTGLSASALSPTSIAASWHPVAGAAGYRVELRNGAGSVSVAEVTADVTATTFTDLVAETAYTVRVSAIGRVEQVGPDADAAVTTPRPAHPAAAPAAPAAADLGTTPAPGLSLSTSSAGVGDTVTVSGLPARTWVYGWLFSDPAPLGWAWTGANGTASFTIPAGVPAGNHRLAIAAADGTLLGWLPLRITAAAPAPAPAALAASGLGVDLGPAAGGAAGALLAGTALIVWGLRRRLAA